MRLIKVAWVDYPLDILYGHCASMRAGIYTWHIAVDSPRRFGYTLSMAGFDAGVKARPDNLIFGRGEKDCSNISWDRSLKTSL